MSEGGSSHRGRRSVLGAIAGSAAGLSGIAGCLSGRERIQVLAATSLTVALEEQIGPAFESETGIRVDGEYHGTNALTRMVEEGRIHPDVVIGVDPGLVRDRLSPDRIGWDVEFATNELVIVYALDTELGTRLEAGDRWYEVLRDADAGAVGIGDPDRSPLGYRALHLFELAEREHDVPGFLETMTERVRVDGGDGQLLGGVDAGARACAIAYRNMAADRGLPSLSLPDVYSFGNPAYEDEYARATHTTSTGRTIPGSPVVYNATVPTGADAVEIGERFVSFLLERTALLEEAGFRVPAPIPRRYGAVPEGIVP
ncbi:extracellular solute-binding protein [Natrarchaeobius sp. A-rgal3]|uniref:extracellular solute-binding protein n=1 Tax=Natrarchaeobius versutus TaxID=1679078 RepID=UPI00351010BD